MPDLPNGTRGLGGTLRARDEVTFIVGGIVVCLTTRGARAVFDIIGYIFGTAVGDKIVCVSTRNAVADVCFFEYGTPPETISRVANA